jgi:hypothetical protein
MFFSHPVSVLLCQNRHLRDSTGIVTMLCGYTRPQLVTDCYHEVRLYAGPFKQEQILPGVFDLTAK